MNFFITLTTACDLQCRYCYGECCDDFDNPDDALDIDYFIPQKVGYSTEALKTFLARDKDPTVIFYGGEPLLNMETMYEMMDELPAKRFMLHTNGTQLHKVKTDYLNRLHTISISIDGDERLNDYYRGQGIYKKITGNARLVRDHGFKGEIIARMTVQEETEIYSQVLHLLNNPDFSFDSVHWQLNALFWKNDYKRRDFARWAHESYDPGVQSLIVEWVRKMREEGKVLRLYPLMSVTRSLLLNEPTLLRCGAGCAEYNIQTDGKISPCPVMAGMKDFYNGDIETSDPMHLTQTLIGRACTGCDVLDICGGRCLYANITMKWGEKGHEEVCSTVKSMVRGLQHSLPEIQALIDSGRISMKDFEHTKFNSCEIIP